MPFFVQVQASGGRDQIAAELCLRRLLVSKHCATIKTELVPFAVLTETILIECEVL